MRSESIAWAATLSKEGHANVRALSKALKAREANNPNRLTYNAWAGQVAKLNADKRRAKEKERAALSTSAGMFGTTVKQNAT